MRERLSFLSRSSPSSAAPCSSSRGPAPADITARFEALEHDVRALQQELNETQERLDFTERLLAKARGEKRVGG